MKALEEKNIGRPSTYAPTISTVLDRRYVERIEGGRLHPTELGELITGLLLEHFKDVVNVEFTAQMEEELDKVEEGKEEWQKVVDDFYKPFKKDLDLAATEMRDIRSEVEVATEVVCDKCGSKMVVKFGRFGKFLACPRYPECKNTKPLEEGPDGVIREKVEEPVDEKCANCSSPMVVKQGRYGRFLACSRYPECKTTKALNSEIGVDCPKGCGGKVVQKRGRGGRSFFGCSSYPKCDFVSWGKPVMKGCPECGGTYLVEKFSKREGPTLVCPNKECGHKEDAAKAA